MTDELKALFAYQTAMAMGARGYISTGVHCDTDEEAHAIAAALSPILGEPVANGETPYRRLTWGPLAHPNATVYLPDEEESA